MRLGVMVKTRLAILCRLVRVAVGRAVGLVREGAMTPMTQEQIEQVVSAVREMRYWQIEYFRSREHTALRSAKDYERRVDELIDSLDRPRLF